MAAIGGRERSPGGGGGGAARTSELLLHPELLSQEFLLLTLEQKNIPIEEELKGSKDNLTDLYVQHVIPLPQRDLPKTRWGKLMEKKRNQLGLKQDKKSTTSENLRKRPPIVFDGCSTSTSIKVRKTENGAVDSLKLLTHGNTNPACKRLSIPSDAFTGVSASSFSPDSKMESRINEAKQNSIKINSNVPSRQKSLPLVNVTGTTVVKLKRAAPKEELNTSNGLKSPELKKKIQHVSWP